jgi:hypothetical protein
MEGSRTFSDGCLSLVLSTQNIHSLIYGNRQNKAYEWVIANGAGTVCGYITVVNMIYRGSCAQMRYANVDRFTKLFGHSILAQTIELLVQTPESGSISPVICVTLLS